MKFPLSLVGRAMGAVVFAWPFGTLASAPSETVVVTGVREPLAISRLAGDVLVIPSERLREAAADSLADVLRREAGVQISRSGGPGQSTGLFIRGAASQQTVLLVDGVRVGSATLGQAAFEAFGLESFERVELLRGPGSSLYGADAVGGVVQLISPDGADETAGARGRRAEARLSLGQRSSREASAGARGRDAGIDWAVGAAHESSAGVSALRPGDAFGNFNPDADGFDRRSWHLRLGAAPAAGQRVSLLLLRTRLDSQYDASEFLLPGFVPDNRPDFRTRLTVEVQALTWRARWSAGVTSTLRVARGIDDARDGGSVKDRFRTERESVAAQLALGLGLPGQLVLAAETQRDVAQSSSFTADASRRNHALAAELTGSAGRISWQADARRDDSSDFGAVSTARAGGALALGGGWRIRALLGSTFRAPSFNDLLFPGYGVPTLAPERGRSVEAGLSWREGAGELGLTLFDNRVRDLIGFQPDPTRCPAGPAYAFGCAGNVARARLRGASVGGAWRSGAWEWRGQWDALSARDADSGQRLQRRAAHQGTLSLQWRGQSVSAQASLLRLGARADGGAMLASETTLNLRGSWRLAPGWALEARIDNAGNERLEPVRDYQGLPRQAWLGLRWGRS